MTTTARELLDIMNVRLAMLEEGLIKPSSAVAEATRDLVDRLADLASDEKVEIVYTTDPLHVEYIRSSTNEVLARIDEVQQAV